MTRCLPPASCHLLLLQYYEELPPEHCVLLGLLRVLLHGVALPLACCYVFELHARRLFLRSCQQAAGGGRGGRAAWLRPQ